MLDTVNFLPDFYKRTIIDSFSREINEVKTKIKKKIEIKEQEKQKEYSDVDCSPPELLLAHLSL